MAAAKNKHLGYFTAGVTDRREGLEFPITVTGFKEHSFKHIFHHCNNMVMIKFTCQGPRHLFVSWERPSVLCTDLFTWEFTVARTVNGSLSHPGEEWYVLLNQEVSLEDCCTCHTFYLLRRKL